MAASTFFPASRSAQRYPVPPARALASAASARTAPRGAGLAAVIAMPARGPLHPDAIASERLREDVAASVPATTALRVVPALSPVRPRKHVRAGVVAAMAVALVFAVSGLISATTAGAGELEVVGHVVLQPGETLWDVAVRSAPAGVDPRRQLDDIRRVNGFGPGSHDAWTVVLLPAR